MDPEKKVLLIDDEQIMHDLSFAYLDRAGYQLLSAYTGESGLQMMLQERPDCVLLDYMMPGIDGEEVFRRLREDEAYREVRDTPVIFLTAKGGDDALKKRLFQKGVLAYLQKPFGLRELSNILDNVFIVNDIRRRNRELERKVKNTREYLDRVIQNAPVGIVTTNEAGDIVEANLRLLRYFPLNSIQELKQLNVFKSPILKSSFIAEGAAHVIETGREWQRKFLKWHLPNGEHAVLTARFVRLSAGSQSDQDGVIGIIEDVTERERYSYELHVLAQVALAMQKPMNLDQLVYLLLSAITAGHALGFSYAILFLVDTKNQSLYGKMAVTASRQEGSRFAWPDLLPENGQQMDLLDLTGARPPGDNDPLTKYVRSLHLSLDADDPLIRTIHARKVFFSREQPSSLASSISTIHRHRFSSFIAVPLVSNDNLLGMIVVDDSETAENELQTRLRLLTLFAGHAANALERASAYAQLAAEKSKLEVAYQRLKLTHERLLHSERLAAIGEMAAHVAHEIRNPLVTIGGFARQLARKAGAAGRENRAANIIVEEVMRLEKILANVLNFSRLPSPRPSHNNINRLLQDISAELRDELDRDQIELILRLQEDLPYFQFDAEQMKQVVLNLLRNSQQSIGRDGRILIETHLITNEVRIKITDTGSGIPKDHIEKIFNPFYTTKEHGTGLGLAICRQIVHEHGGTITVNSERGIGTIFQIHLPVSGDILEPTRLEIGAGAQ